VVSVVYDLILPVIQVQCMSNVIQQLFSHKVWKKCMHLLIEGKKKCTKENKSIAVKQRNALYTAVYNISPLLNLDCHCLEV